MAPWSLPTLQRKAGYFDARPLTANSTMFSKALWRQEHREVRIAHDRALRSTLRSVKFGYGRSLPGLVHLPVRHHDRWLRHRLHVPRLTVTAPSVISASVSNHMWTWSRESMGQARLRLRGNRSCRDATSKLDCTAGTADVRRGSFATDWRCPPVVPPIADMSLYRSECSEWDGPAALPPPTAFRVRRGLVRRSTGHASHVQEALFRC